MGDLIEDLASRRQVQQQGITRSPADGGDREPALAAQYRAWAEGVSDRCQHRRPPTLGGGPLRGVWAHRKDDRSEHFENESR